MLFVLCGVPGSGKTTISQSLAEEYDATLYTFDDLPHAFSASKCTAVRAQMWGDIAKDLRAGKNVVCDDVHTKLIWREGLLSATDGLSCERILMVVTTPLEECLRRNANRERRLPDFIVTAFAKCFETPDLSEGWDEIKYI